MSFTQENYQLPKKIEKKYLSEEERQSEEENKENDEEFYDF
jgi:hypothetical protein